MDIVVTGRFESKVYGNRNMTKEDILRLRDTAEQTRVQFKERVSRDNKYDVSCEMVAQSNSRGGVIVVGIDDKNGLPQQEAQEELYGLRP